MSVCVGFSGLLPRPLALASAVCKRHSTQDIHHLTAEEDGRWRGVAWRGADGWMGVLVLSCSFFVSKRMDRLIGISVLGG